MTHRRDRSLRAQARAMLKQARLASSPAASDPPASEPTLTERARALYEDSVVPVREIARLVGVTERTILKYARKYDWKPRYRWKEGRAGERHRGWQPTPEFAPMKGAGARFVKREDAGKPFAIGLKANDPPSAAHAAKACEQAQALSARAEQQVAFVREMERREKAYTDATSLLSRVLALPDPREEEAGPWPRNKSRERAVAGCVRLAVLNWDMALDGLAAKSSGGEKLWESASNGSNSCSS
jgi:hypothetical protein